MLLDNETPAGAIRSEGVFSRGVPESDARLTLGQVIRRTAHQFPNRPAIISSAFAPLTYQGLEHQLDAIKQQLRLAGLGCKCPSRGSDAERPGSGSRNRGSRLLHHRGSSRSASLTV